MITKKLSIFLFRISDLYLLNNLEWEPSLVNVFIISQIEYKDY